MEQIWIPNPVTDGMSCSHLCPHLKQVFTEDKMSHRCHSYKKGITKMRRCDECLKEVFPTFKALETR